MVASTSLNASVELARAIASMHTILRTGPVITSGLDDQPYALGDWRSGPPRRWSGHATLAVLNKRRRARSGHSVADGIVRVIPPLLHGYADVVVTVALILLPFILGFDDSTAALLFYAIVGGAGLLATLATRFEPRVPEARAMTSPQAA